jgi:hypothetical protein
MWRLAVQYSPRLALVFCAASPDFLNFQQDLPEEFRKIAADLGSLHFSQFSGHLIWPSFIPETSCELQTRFDLDPAEPVSAFFDHHTGDYDCWKAHDSFDAWYLDHETATMSLYSTGGFPQWLEKRFQEHLTD